MDEREFGDKVQSIVWKLEGLTDPTIIGPTMRELFNELHDLIKNVGEENMRFSRLDEYRKKMDFSGETRAIEEATNLAVRALKMHRKVPDADPEVVLSRLTSQLEEFEIFLGQWSITVDFYVPEEEGEK